MVLRSDEFEIDDSLNRVDFEKVHSWLTTTYWTPGISQEKVERGAANCAMVVGVYSSNEQVAYMRVISDKTSFAWIADVFVSPDFRRKGIATQMVKFAQGHPDFQGLRRWVLATRDAHPVYAAAGFQPLDMPERWMIYYPPKESEPTQAK